MEAFEFHATNGHKLFLRRNLKILGLGSKDESNVFNSLVLLEILK